MNLNIRGLFLLSQRIGKLSMIPRAGPHHQRGVDRGLAGNPPGDGDHCLQHLEGRRGQLHAHAGGRVGRAQHHRQRAGAGLLPVEDDQGSLDRMGVDKMCEGVPLHRLGDDEDLKGAALLFASDAGKHITGQILAVDGGVSAV
jgi:gluconate 5-dehydrogenase